MGTGPWVFKEWVRGSHVLYERNPTYWQPGKPYLDRLIVHYLTDPAARSIALENGEVDIAPRAAIPYSDFARLTALPHLAISDSGLRILQQRAAGGIQPRPGRCSRTSGCARPSPT